MIGLLRTDYIRAFIIGFIVAGVPMAATTGLFS
jgi:hypothetical protein